MRGGLRPGIRQVLAWACLLVLLSGSVQAYTTILNRDSFQWEGDRVQEPASDFSPENTSAQALSGTFLQDHPVAQDSAWLLPGEDSQAQVVRIQGLEEGPCVYVIAGVHGNERAAWMAGLLLRDVSIKGGCLHVLAPANAPGAREGSRFVKDRQDLNRSFPGDPEGGEAQRLAAAIWEDI